MQYVSYLLKRAAAGRYDWWGLVPHTMHIYSDTDCTVLFILTYHPCYYPSLIIVLSLWLPHWLASVFTDSWIWTVQRGGSSIKYSISCIDVLWYFSTTKPLNLSEYITKIWSCNTISVHITVLLCVDQKLSFDIKIGEMVSNSDFNNTAHLHLYYPSINTYIWSMFWLCESSKGKVI